MAAAREAREFTWRWKATIIWIAFCCTFFFVRAIILWAMS